MGRYSFTCPECGNSDDISLGDAGDAFCMECEHGWATVTFGQRFFEATVEAAGIPAGHGSVSALAARLDIQRATVSRWKSGKQAPTPEHQAAIAERLGMALCVIYDVGRWFITYQDGT